LDTEESKEGYGQWKSDPGSYFQHTNASLLDFYSSSNPEDNKSFFSIIETKCIDDYHKDRFTCIGEPFLSYEQRDEFANDEFHEVFVENDDQFSKQQVSSPQHLTVNIGDHLTFLTYDDFHNYMCLNFGQEKEEELQEKLNMFSFSSNDALTTPVVPTPGINGSNQLPSDFYDAFALKVVEDIYAQENNQQLQGKFVAQNFYEDQDAYDNITIDVGSNTIDSFSIASNSSSSDGISTLNLKGEIDSGNRLQHFPIPFLGLKNEDVNVFMEANFSQGKSVHLEQKEHEFTINTEVTGHDFYDLMVAYLEDFIIFNPPSWFHSKCGVRIQSNLSFHFQIFISTKQVQEIQLVDKLLEWLLWKFVYT
jgi:hypothetical protein